MATRYKRLARREFTCFERKLPIFIVARRQISGASSLRSAELMRKKTIVLLTIATGFLLFVGYCVNQYRKPWVGYETDTSKSAIYLERVLHEKFNYEDFSQDWLVESWANGFQDHTYLYKLLIPVDDIEGFRDVFDFTPKADTSAPIVSSTYLGPSTPPEWWEKDVVDAADHSYAKTNRYRMRYSKVANFVYLVVVSN